MASAFRAADEERRPYAWGRERIDLKKTHAYAGGGAAPKAVKQSPQDKTPSGLYDMMGNAQEWTESLWREDIGGTDESWTLQGETSFRAVRGLPLARPTPLLPEMAMTPSAMALSSASA